MRTNADVTLYNRYVVAGAELYQRHPLVAVAWENRKAANVLATGGTIAANSARVFIPFARGAAFLGPVEWQALTSKTNYWTLQEGDYVVKGLVSDEISSNFTITDLIAKYDDVLKIASVDTKDMGSENMRHWELGLK